MTSAEGILTMPSGTGLAAKIRVGSGRRTGVAEETLMRWFQPPTPIRTGDDDENSPRRRSNSCAVQTTVSMVDVALLQRLVGVSNDVGVVTATHAMERHKALLFALHTHRVLFENEDRERQCIEDHRESQWTLLSTLATESLNTATLASRRSETRTTPSTRRSQFDATDAGDRASSPFHSAGPSSPLLGGRRSVAGSRQSSGDAEATGTAVGCRVDASPTASPPRGRGSEDVDKLKYKIHMLQHRVRSVAKLETSNQSRNTQIWTTTNAMRSRPEAIHLVPLEKRLETLCATEASERCDVDDEECMSWRNVTLEAEIFTLKIQLRTASRYMLHAPFTSYRPKIPIQHSLAGEEYLRRWILVETLQHYEDCLSLLQQHENDKRNAIEDEEESMRLGLKARCFLPFFVGRCESLEATMESHVQRSREQMKRADSLYAMLQLRVIVEEESMLRVVIHDFAMSALGDLQVLNGELGQVRGVHALAKTLEHKLSRRSATARKCSS